MFVTSRSKEALRIKAEREQNVSVLTFGSEGGHTQSSEVIKVGQKAKDGPDRELELLVVPLICQALTTQPIDLCIKEFEHLSHLELANSSDGETTMEVDILIG